MKNLARLLFAAALALGTWACDSGSGDSEEGGGGGGTSMEALTIEGLGLTMQAPAGATIRTIGDNYMISGQNLAVSVRVANDNLDAANVESGLEAMHLFNPTETRTEDLEDGWAIIFQNEGGAGTNYWVQVRRVINGTSYWCETTASSPQQQQNALDACKSLTP